MSEEDIQSLPNSNKCEMSILSSMMQDPSLIDEAVELGINSESWYKKSHTIIFDRLLYCSNHDESVELISLSQHFKDQKILENLGGASRLCEIYSFSPTSAYFKSHCEIVLEKFKLRKIITTCSFTIAKAYENPDNVDQFLDEIEKNVFSIRRQYEKQSEESFRDLVKGSISRLYDYIEGKSEVDGLPTRFKVYNDLTKGLRNSDLVILAGRPSMGKTALMCNVVEDLTFDGIQGMVFSCEMTKNQLVDRILFGRAKFPMHYIKPGFSPTKNELESIKSTFSEAVEKNLIIDDTPAIHIDELRAKARRKKRECDIKYIAGDYLQLMTGNSRNNREREIAEISAGLKSLAKELNIPVIILAQLNRGPEKRQGNIPRISDLRESGSVEQDADVIGLLYRSDYYSNDEDGESSDRGSDKNTNLRGSKNILSSMPATLILAKNRNGPTGEVEMKFQKEIMEFV